MEAAYVGAENGVSLAVFVFFASVARSLFLPLYSSGAAVLASVAVYYFSTSHPQLPLWCPLQLKLYPSRPRLTLTLSKLHVHHILTSQHRQDDGHMGS